MRPVFYVTGGTLPSDSPCYVERQADRDLLDALLDAQFCYVLDTRQVGKSSLVERTARKLRERGVAVAKIDLTTTGKEVTAAQWYNGMLRQVADSLQAAGMPDYWDDLRGFWRDNSELGPMQRWVEALRAVVLANSDTNLVIFVDEIESVRSFDFTDEFFAGIRACYNRRVDEPALRRLTFCLAGSATPEELIHSVTSTPFNIGHAITLSDFTREEAAVLAAGLADRALLDRVLYWTNGHPYLTQRLCAEITEADMPTTDLSPVASAASAPRPSSPPDARLVDALCRRLFLAPEARKSEKNLAFVAKRILDSPLDRAGLLDLYGRVRRGRVINDDKDALQSTLRLSGVARARNGRLTVRNRIYERVFDPAWIRENMPNAEVHRQRATAWRVGLSIGSVAAVVLAAMSWLTFRAVRAESLANTNATLARQKTREADASANMAQRNADDARRSAHEAQHLAAERALALTNAQKEKTRADQNAAEAKKQAHEATDYARRMAAAQGIAADASHRAQHAASEANRQAKAAETKSDENARLAYIANMNLIQREWDNNNVAHVLELLKTTAAYKGRGFEWGYWNHLCHLDLKTLTGHTGEVHAVAFSPDGTKIVTGSHDNTAKVWDVQTGRELLTLKGHVRNIESVAFSPDGTKIITGSMDFANNSAVKVWDAVTGRELLTLPINGSAWTVSFSPDGKRIGTGNYQGQAKIWDAATGKELLTLKGYTRLGSGDTSVNCITFFSDGKRIITGSNDKTAKVWDAATGQELLSLKGHTNSVDAAVFSPDGRRIVTGSEDNTARVWDAQTGKEIMRLEGHTSEVHSAMFSPDGTRIITGSWDGTAKIWNAQTGQELSALKSHAGLVASVAISPDGKRIVTGSYDKTAKIWDAQTGRESMTLEDYFQAEGALSHDGKRLITRGANNTAEVWDTQAECKLLILKGHTGSVYAGTFSLDGMHIVTSSEDKTVRVWDAKTGHELVSFKQKEYTDGIEAIAVSLDGKHIFVSYYGDKLRENDGRTVMWDVQTGKRLLRLAGVLSSGSFSPDGKCMVINGKNLDPRTGREKLTLNDYKTREKYFRGCIAFSPDSKRIVESYGNAAEVWDSQTGRKLLTLKGHVWPITAVVFSPDGKRIVTGSQDKTAKLWDVATGQELLTLKGGHMGFVNSVAFTSDGKQIVVTSHDENKFLLTKFD